jgi:hypothetical protein
MQNRIIAVEMAADLVGPAGFPFGHTLAFGKEDFVKGADIVSRAECLRSALPCR